MSRQHIHVSSKTYKSPDAPSYVVLVSRDKRTDGEYYRVNAVGLELLRRGWTPEKIGLDPLDDEAERRAEQEEFRMYREQDRSAMYPNEALTDVCKMLLEDWDLNEEQVAALAADLAREFEEHMMARNEAAWERRYSDLAESGGVDDSHYREAMKAAAGTPPEMTKRRRPVDMKSWNEIHSERVSGINEWHARTAIRDLLHEHDGNMTAVSLNLSVWLDEEYQIYINRKEPRP